MAIKPSKSITVLQQNGLKALGLVAPVRPALEPRLGAGLIDGLERDLKELGSAVPQVRATKRAAIALTGRQNDAVSHAHALVSAVRQAVGRSELPAALRKTYGVGQKLNNRSVKGIKAALMQIIAAAQKNPDEALRAGVLPSDVEALQGALETVGGADEAQELARARSPLTTRERNSIARRVQNATARIGAAGVLQFATEPAKREAFQQLIGKG